MVSSDPSSLCSTTCTSIYINNLSNCQCFVCFFLDSDLSAQTAGKVVAKMARQLLGPPTWSICVVNGDGVAVSNPTPSAGNCKRNELVRTHTHTPHHVAQINERDKGLESGGVSGIRGSKGGTVHQAVGQLGSQTAKQEAGWGRLSWGQRLRQHALTF